MTAAPLRLTILGMRCAGCSSAVEKALKAVPGVSDARVNLALATAEVDAPFLANMAAMAAGRGDLLPPLAQLLLATPVQAIAGWRFHAGAVRALAHGSANMDVLVSLGTTVAYLFSLALLLTAPAGHAPHLYFEASALIITLVLFGKWLEERAKRGATAAIRALMALKPESALIERLGVGTILPIALVRVGDVALVKPGERIPVDGVVVDDDTETDDSLITGESLPVTKGKGDAVTAGAINGSGLIRVEATRIGADTTLSRIVALVAAAQGGKAPIQRLVDRVAAVFVPVVVSVAALTFALWMLSGAAVEHAVTAAVSVLVIACPCALGFALVAGTGAAAQAGILIRDIETLERAVAVDTAIFDKTGTLTEGKPRVAAVQALTDEAEMIRLAAAAQAGSEHPLARAILAHAAGIDLPPVSAFRAEVGGLTATVEGRAVTIGSEALFAARGIDTAPPGGDPGRLARPGAQHRPGDGGRGSFGGDRPDRRAAPGGRRGDRPGATARHRPGAAVRRPPGSDAPHRRKPGDRAFPRRGAARGQGGARRRPARRRPRRRDDRRRRQRRPGPGRRGCRHRHRRRHRRRHGNRRNHPDAPRPASGRRHLRHRASDATRHPAKSVLGLRLQRRRHSGRGDGPATPVDRRSGDGDEFGQRRRQRAAAATLEAMTGICSIRRRRCDCVPPPSPRKAPHRRGRSGLPHPRRA